MNDPGSDVDLRRDHSPPNDGSASSASTGARPVAPARGRRRTRPTGDVAAIVRAWRTLCTTEAFGGENLIFENPASIVGSVLRDASEAVASPSTVITCNRLRTPLVDPLLEVIQLVALSRVVHHRIDGGASSAAATRAGATIDGVVNAAIFAALDALEQLGLVDPLTGLLNRRALDRHVVEQIRRAQRRARCLTVVMVDVDGLKTTNDRFGHAAGDRRLRDTAASLSSGLRAGDNVYRIGGDEFVILLPDLAPVELATVMERLSDAAATALTWGCAWIGGAAALGDPGEHAVRLLELADLRLLTCRSVGPPRPAPGAVALAGRLGPSTADHLR